MRRRAAGAGARRGRRDVVAALARSRGHRRHRRGGGAALAVDTVPSTGQPASQRLSILPPPGERSIPDSTGVAVSPDGTMVAFVVGSVARSENELWVRSLESMSARRLEDTRGCGAAVLVA